MKLPIPMKFIKCRRSVLTVFCLGTIGLFAGCYQFTISFEPAVSEVSDSTEHFAAALPEVNNGMTDQSSSDLTTSNIRKPSKLFAYPSNINNTGTEGKFRASNQTNQPVRLALLARRNQNQKTNSKQANPAKNHIPAHWDFAPQEGSEAGMVLSLPKGNLNLEPGDIIVAFAQDGSRRYWGPYVIGETPYPAWNGDTKEWQLILTP